MNAPELEQAAALVRASQHQAHFGREIAIARALTGERP